MTDFEESMEDVAKRHDLVEKLVLLLPETTIHCLRKTDNTYRVTWTKPETETQVEVEAPDFVTVMEKAIAEAGKP